MMAIPSFFSTGAPPSRYSIFTTWFFSLNVFRCSSYPAFRAIGFPVSSQVISYFVGRLGAIARDEGAAPDTIKAVADTGVCDPAPFLNRAAALEEARRTQREVFEDLATAYARASHLADAALGVDVDLDILGEAELALFKAVDTRSQKVEDAIVSGDLDAAIAQLAKLREPIDRFFDDVLVMDEDLSVRNNRLRLLNKFEQAFAGIANIGALAKKR